MGRSAIVHLVGVAVAGILGLAITAGVSRRLGYDDLGLYTLGLGALLFVAMTTRLGLDTAALHYVANHRARREGVLADTYAYRALFLSGLLGSAGGLGMWISAPYVQGVMGQPGLEAVLRAFAWGVPFYNLLYVSAGALRGAQAIVPSVAASRIAYPVANFVAVAAILLFRPDLLLVVYATVVALCASAAIAVYHLIREFRLATVEVPLRAFVRYGAGNLVIQGMNYAVLWFGIYLVGFLLSSQDVGFFRAAGHTAVMLTLVMEAFGSLYAPLSSGLLAQGDLPHLEEVTKSVSRITFFGTAALAIPVLLTPDLVLIPFGENIGPAVVPLALLAVGHAAAAILGPSSWVLITGDRLDLSILAKIPSIILGIGLAFVLIPLYGVTGAALATVAAVLVRQVAHYLCIKRAIEIQPLSRRLARGIIGYGAILAAGWLLTYSFPGGAMVVAGASLGAFLLVGPFVCLTLEDRQVLRGVISFVIDPAGSRVSRPEDLLEAGSPAGGVPSGSPGEAREEGARP